MDRNVVLDEEKVPYIADHKKKTLARSVFVTLADGKKVFVPPLYFELSLQRCSFCGVSDLGSIQTTVGKDVKQCLDCEKVQHHFVQCSHPWCKKANMYFWTGFLIPGEDLNTLLECSAFFCSREHRDTHLEVEVYLGEKHVTIEECSLGVTVGDIFKTALQSLGIEGDDLEKSYCLVSKGKKYSLVHEEVLANLVTLDTIGEPLELEILSQNSTLSKPTKVEVQRKEKKKKKKETTKKRPRKKEAEPYIEGIQYTDKIKWQERHSVKGTANPTTAPRNQRATNILCLFLKPDHFTPEQLLDGTIPRDHIFNDGNTLMILLTCPTSVNLEKEEIKRELMESGFPWERIKELSCHQKVEHAPSPSPSTPPPPTKTTKKKRKRTLSPKQMLHLHKKYLENVKNDIALKTKLVKQKDPPLEEEEEEASDFDKAYKSAQAAFHVIPATQPVPPSSSSPYPSPYRSPRVPAATPLSPTTPQGLHFSETDATRAAMKESQIDFHI